MSAPTVAQCRAEVDLLRDELARAEQALLEAKGRELGISVGDVVTVNSHGTKRQPIEVRVAALHFYGFKANKRRKDGEWSKVQSWFAPDAIVREVAS